MVLHPLAGRNLEAAVRELAAESPIPTDVVVDELEMPDEIATELYFVCAEGLANAAKHSAATACSISAMATDRGVLLRITDDGHGGATLGSSGLLGLVDRVGALGGMVTIVSPRGGGTRIDVDLPLPRQ
jgi:signal transduction histidine kinase